MKIEEHRVVTAIWMETGRDRGRSLNIDATGASGAAHMLACILDISMQANSRTQVWVRHSVKIRATNLFSVE